MLTTPSLHGMNSEFGAKEVDVILSWILINYDLEFFEVDIFKRNEEYPIM